MTGRILAQLRSVLPGVDERFDAIVGENGAMVAHGGRDGARLSAPVPGELDVALAARGVAFQRGEVLLACDGADGEAVLEAVRKLGWNASSSGTGTR